MGNPFVQCSGALHNNADRKPLPSANKPGTPAGSFESAPTRRPDLRTYVLAMPESFPGPSFRHPLTAPGNTLVPIVIPFSDAQKRGSPRRPALIALSITSRPNATRRSSIQAVTKGIASLRFPWLGFAIFPTCSPPSTKVGKAQTRADA